MGNFYSLGKVRKLKNLGINYQNYLSVLSFNKGNSVIRKFVHPYGIKSNSLVEPKFFIGLAGMGPATLPDRVQFLTKPPLTFKLIGGESGENI